MSEKNEFQQSMQKPSLSIDTAPTLETAATGSSSFDSSRSAGETWQTPQKSSGLTQMSPGVVVVATPVPEERAVGRVQAESPPKERSSPERVVNTHKKIMRLDSRVFTDSDNLLPFGLSFRISEGEDEEEKKMEQQEEMKNISEFFHDRCVSLRIFMEVSNSKDDDSVKDVQGEGQAFIIKIGREAFMVTVKHNFCSETNNDSEYEKCDKIYANFPGVSKSYKVHLKDGLLGWDADAHEDTFEPTGWKYGNELVKIPLGERLVNKVKLFQAVSPTFRIEKDMEVGIMAHSNKGLLAESIQKQMQKIEGEEYEAQKGDIFITVGRITCVGAEHIEYDANTVHGFSGAPVFLLSGGLENIKVIAVHAGYSNKTGKNFGFLISPEIKTTANETCLIS